MAIDPPYRLDPFRNIINVHWESATEEPTGGYPEFLYCGADVLIYFSGIGGYAAADATPPSGFYSDSAPSSTTGMYGYLVGSISTNAGSYEGAIADYSGELTATGANWRALDGSGNVIGGPWYADYSGLVLHTTRTTVHDYVFDGVELMTGGEGGYSPVGFHFYVRFRW